MVSSGFDCRFYEKSVIKFFFIHGHQIYLLHFISFASILICVYFFHVAFWKNMKIELVCLVRVRHIMYYVLEFGL